MTDKFDPDDDRHRAIKQDLMRGIALKEIATMGEVNRALENGGISGHRGNGSGRRGERSDHAVVSAHKRPRAETLDNALYRIPMGRKAFIGAARLAEVLGVVPKGSADVVGLMGAGPPKPVSRVAGPGSSRRCTVSWLANPSRRSPSQSRRRSHGAFPSCESPRGWVKEGRAPVVGVRDRADQASLRALNSLTWSVMARSGGQAFDARRAEEPDACGKPPQRFTHVARLVEGPAVADDHDVGADSVARPGDCRHAFDGLVEGHGGRRADGARRGEPDVGDRACPRPPRPSSPPGVRRRHTGR